ncbi:multidrug transporter MatE [Telmatospirillum siberiense]|uniref:Multidrug transporter MatE n=2 Tax=Telmatospirillum siberiense TaxID=382514 RepID=A0A2N3PQS0_9PROT|nr:multidrug transporter MatE [Telmatospirillum siberiense]
MTDIPLLLDPLFLAQTATILAVPGPTNALLATAGATKGIRVSIRFVAVVLTAYLGAILAWGLLLIPASAAWPPLMVLARLGCALFLAATALRLWRGTTSLAATPASPITNRTLTLATLLNPKALLFATGIFPATAFTQSDVFYSTALAFAAPLVPITLAWIAFGASLASSQSRISPKLAHRAAAILLACFSASIGLSAVV